VKNPRVVRISTALIYPFRFRQTTLNGEMVRINCLEVARELSASQPVGNVSIDWDINAYIMSMRFEK